MPDAPPPPVVIARPVPKPWWKSRTVLFNMAVLALAGAESQLNFLQPLLPVNVYSLIAFALPIVNGALRLVTSAGVTLRSAVAQAGSEQ